MHYMLILCYVLILKMILVLATKKGVIVINFYFRQEYLSYMKKSKMINMEDYLTHVI